MKKPIVSAVILLAVLLGSCSGAGTDMQDSANSTAEAKTQTSAISTEADTAAVTTEEPSETEATDAAPAFDINDDNCLPYRLINMTYSEIEAEFGPLKQDEWRYGASPAYKSDKLDGIVIVFIRTSGNRTDENGAPLADYDDKPGEICVSNKEITVFPGLKIGMNGKEVYDVLRKYYPEVNSNNLSYNPMSANIFYSISFAVQDNCGITLNMGISGLEDEYPDLYTGTPEDFDYEKSEQMLFDEEVGTLGYIKIYEIINQ